MQHAGPSLEYSSFGPVSLLLDNRHVEFITASGHEAPVCMDALLRMHACMRACRIKGNQSCQERTLWICTASAGSTCWGFMKSRGSYAPMGMAARSKGPRRCPISGKAGQ